MVWVEAGAGDGIEALSVEELSAAPNTSPASGADSADCETAATSRGVFWYKAKSLRTDLKKKPKSPAVAMPASRIKLSWVLRSVVIT